MYENEEEVKCILEKAKEIFPDLSNSRSYRIYNNRIIMVTILVALKGNKEVIRALKNLGWKCSFRERIYSPDYRCYIIAQNMVYSL